MVQNASNKPKNEDNEGRNKPKFNEKNAALRTLFRLEWAANETRFVKLQHHI